MLTMGSCRRGKASGKKGLEKKSIPEKREKITEEKRQKRKNSEPWCAKLAGGRFGKKAKKADQKKEDQHRRIFDGGFMSEEEKKGPMVRDTTQS